MERRKPMKRSPIKRAPKKRKPKTEKQRKKDRADDLFSKLVREPGYCFAFGWKHPDYPAVRCSEKGLQCAHIIGRASLVIRWNFLNAVPLCPGHHKWFTHEPDAWTAFIEEKYPGRKQRLKEIQRAERFDGDYDALLAYLTSLVPVAS